MCLFLDFEELADGEAERAGDNQPRERLNRVVVRQHGVVVDLAADGDAVLGLGEFRLQLAKVLVPEVRGASAPRTAVRARRRGCPACPASAGVFAFWARVGPP